MNRPHPKTLPLTTQFTPKLQTLPPARPATKQKAANVPAISFSSSAIAGLSDGDDARIIDKLEMYLVRYLLVTIGCGLRGRRTHSISRMPGGSGSMRCPS